MGLFQATTAHGGWGNTLEAVLADIPVRDETVHPAAPRLISPALNSSTMSSILDDRLRSLISIGVQMHTWHQRMPITTSNGR